MLFRACLSTYTIEFDSKAQNFSGKTLFLADLAWDQVEHAFVAKGTLCHGNTTQTYSM